MFDRRMMVWSAGGVNRYLTQDDGLGQWELYTVLDK